ncbi:MAG: hypothetical protein QOK19_2199 [Solirubrobacteraceae bacterium]|nr:Methyltransferase type 11 [Solirubrobacterales bacterium]MEA2216638.1 hypothetical protein [Solirubrobacteraceae bacterium]
MPSRLVDSYRTARLRLPQPWSRTLGQLLYSPRLVTGHLNTRREFAEEPIIERLALSQAPLDRIGEGCTERVVEVPWVIRKVRELNPHRMLDVGSAFAPMIYKWLLVRQSPTIETVDLADASVPGLANHVADIRSLPFDVDAFDLATCISTLEHIGMDNTQYSIQSGGAGDVQALTELGRVARRVLVTTPCGRASDMPHQRQYSPERFRRAAADAGLIVEQLDLFAHTPGAGWSPASEEDVLERNYGERAAAAAAVLCAQLTRGS